jgi:hypothetical protein
MIVCASHDVVAGHTRSVRIQSNKWKLTRGDVGLLRGTCCNRRPGSPHPGNSGPVIAQEPRWHPFVRKRTGDMSPRTDWRSLALAVLAVPGG